MKSTCSRTESEGAITGAVWRLVSYFILAVFVSVLIVGVINRESPTLPLIIAVEPPAGMPGETVSLLGRNIGKSRVAELYLAGARGRWKAEIVSQSPRVLRFKIPADADSGVLTLVVKTAEKTPQWIEERASVLVRGQ